MPSPPRSVHRPPLKLFDPAYHTAAGTSARRPAFDYSNPIYRAAHEKALALAAGRCAVCLRMVPLELEVHHRTVPYPPADKTTADDLLALCRVCHDTGHDVGFLDAAGVSLERYRACASELVASLSRPVDDGRQVGRAVWFGDDWGALVTGASRPRVGGIFWLLQRKRRAWVTVAVTDVVDGRPGHWRVRKMFLGAGGGEERRPLRCRPGAVRAGRSAA